MNALTLFLVISCTGFLSFAKSSTVPFEGIIDNTQIYHPSFESPSIKPKWQQLEDEPVEEPAWSPDLLVKFANIHIKIFPHHNKYNSPHGVDTVINKVTLSSAGDCTAYKAGASSEGGILRDDVVMTGKSFNLTATSVKQPMWIECTAPIQVTRVDYPKAPTRYKGVVYVKPIKIGNNAAYLTLVNVLPFDEYMKGVVPSEMPASWSYEALKVQAIAARSYALYEASSNVYKQDSNIVAEESGAQFDDTVTYQAYKGLNNTTAATDKAVEETKGQIMIHEGKVVKAYFHADSGGYTENAENVWGKYYPYIIAKPELYPDGSIPGTVWTYSPSFDEIQTKMSANDILGTNETLVDLKIEADDLFPSSRPQHVTLVIAGKPSKKVLAVDFAFAMRVKSQWIKIKTNAKAKTATFTGRGFGHGAGMNQWGARVLVDKLNMNFTDVLKFYYTGIEITPVISTVP